MKRPLMAVLLSALTYFGGHFYNNRWVRSTFFGTLLIIWFLLYLPLSFFITFLWGSTILDYQHITNILVKVWIFGFSLIWISSAIVAAVDAKHPNPNIEEKGIFSKWFSIIGMCSIGMFAVISMPFIWFFYTNGRMISSDYMISTEQELITEAPDISERKKYLGSTNTSYGGDFNWSSQKVLASGPGLIRGNIFVDNKPCEGLKLRLFLSDELRSQWTTSDKNGVYEIPVPYGKYLYQGWELDQKSADKVLAGKILADRLGRGEKILSITEDSKGTGPAFYFANPVIRKKPLGEITLSEKVVFEWEPYTNASFYEIWIIDIGTNLRGRKWKNLSKLHDNPQIEKNRISISELGVGLESGHYYIWLVKAYDKEGKFLSETPNIGEYNFKVK